jgi:hypothetical protein
MKANELMTKVESATAAMGRPDHILIHPKYALMAESIIRDDPNRVASPAGLLRLFPALRRGPLIAEK